MTETYTPIEVGIALALYAYNTSAPIRARRLFFHFEGQCMELHDMIDVLDKRGAYVCTELPKPTAVVYVAHALRYYGGEARLRALADG